MAKCDKHFGRKYVHISTLILIFLGWFPPLALAFDVGDVAQIGLAYGVKILAHEGGHALVGELVGAEGTRVDFITKRQGNLFLGYASYTYLPETSRLPFLAGGFISNSVGFEVALESYRHNPTTFNTALLLFSGTDFL